MSNLRVKDLEILQGTLNQVGLDYQLELDEGKILVRGYPRLYFTILGNSIYRLSVKYFL